MTLYFSGTPVDQATLDLPGTDIETAVAGRVPLAGIECRMVLARVVDKGWREIYDGPSPDIWPDQPMRHSLIFAAPETDARDTWILVSFLEQDDGTYSTMGSPNSAPYEEQP